MNFKQMVSLYEETQNLRDVMKASKRDFYTTKKILLSEGVVLKKRRWKSKLSREEIVCLYETNSVSQIAELNGTSNSIILRELKDAGVKMRGRGSGISRNRGTHGFASRAIELGMNPFRYVRLLAIIKLGGECVKCGYTDIRALTLNHIDGKGVEKKNGLRDPGPVYKSCLSILAGNEEAHLEVLCHNCNHLHEYDRCNIPHIPDTVLDALSSFDWGFLCPQHSNNQEIIL